MLKVYLAGEIHTNWRDEIIDECKAFTGTMRGPGGIAWFYGEGNRQCISAVNQLPKSGDLYIFPATLKHWVFPFRSKVERVSVSGNFTLLTGTPVTFPTSKYVIQGFAIPHNLNNSRNDYRIPNYHRLDIAVTINGKKINKKGNDRKNNNSLVIGIYNLYNRKNPFSIYFSQGKETVSETFVPGQVTRLSIIGSFVPSITYNFKI